MRGALSVMRTNTHAVAVCGAGTKVWQKALEPTAPHTRENDYWEGMYVGMCRLARVSVVLEPSPFFLALWRPHPRYVRPPPQPARRGARVATSSALDDLTPPVPP